MNLTELLELTEDQLLAYADQLGYGTWLREHKAWIESFNECPTCGACLPPDWQPAQAKP